MTRIRSREAALPRSEHRSRTRTSMRSRKKSAAPSTPRCGARSKLRAIHIARRRRSKMPRQDSATSSRKLIVCATICYLRTSGFPSFSLLTSQAHEKRWTCLRVG